MMGVQDASIDVLNADRNDDVLDGDDPFVLINQLPMREGTEQLTSIDDICISSSKRETYSRNLLKLSNSIIIKRKEYSSLHSLKFFDIAFRCTSLQDRETINNSLANIHSDVKADPVLSTN
ncbi:hypothetical protein INT46_011065 [Mucor plumbeus]|uniref:Uncharacterized protein n=1 Tax=Mucor plumbeus TaxID=97098 RepID=A0A8H7UL40_9FUNG|nr:hypothetical protein INT46_011065 [Mucor plumbeus]